MGRFCVTPRTNRPRRVLLIRKATPPSTASAKATMITRFQGSCRLSSSRTPPLIHAGFSTPTFCAPNTVRTSCISTRLLPQVASRVSSGRPYRKRITPRSMAMPTSPATRKASGTAISSDSMPNMKFSTMSPPSAMKKVVITNQAAASAATIDSA